MRVWMLAVAIWMGLSIDAAAQHFVQFGRVVKVERMGDESIVTIAAGTDQGIERHAKAWLVTEKNSTEPIRDGNITVIRVDRRTTVGKTRVTLAQIQDHPWVVFELAAVDPAPLSR